MLDKRRSICNSQFSLLNLQCCLLFLVASVHAAQIPIRIDTADNTFDKPIPVCGGIPFPQGALKSTDNIRLVNGGAEIPCQATKTAVWPDGSVKWALIDALIAPKDAANLTLEFGDGIKRAEIADPLVAASDASAIKISGGGIVALIKKDGGGVLDELSLGGKRIVTADKPARLHIDSLRVADSATALPTNTFVCRDPNAKLDLGKVQIDSLAVESPGPIRATILIRGHVLLPHFGETLPDEVKKRDPAGQLPFSMRLSFYKNSGVIYGQHQIIFSGEPDNDFISNWGIDIPGQTGPRDILVLEPGATIHRSNDFSRSVPAATAETTKVVTTMDRLCWAPLKSGLALIRQGWENRPCGISQSADGASINFWPREAGLFDLRRYAREWSVGESGDTKNPKEIERYAKYAARGLAKSHDFVLYFGNDYEGEPGAAVGGKKPLVLGSRALLLAPPSWYGASEALGAFAPEQTAGDFAALDATTRRALDYHLFSQDLFGWYGKLTYGFFQYRYGQVHRTDRWDNDYGRWGWSLADGAGRIGHVLMLQFLRTGERRYFDGGEAFGRITYDTNMVHTQQHLEGSKNWWTAQGCCHRHNVQPFGCPYIGMRGSYPVGQRIQYALTGDGVILDGLEMVADACFKYTEGAKSRLCNSGSSDGQGSAANAMLWKYEQTGDKKYLAACRQFLDVSGLIPPKDVKQLEYGPSFGLFNAAGEYAQLSGDKEFQQRVVELGKLGAQQKDPRQFTYAMAMACRFTQDAAQKDQLAATLKKIAADQKPSLSDLPPDQWPGHAGWRTPELDANFLRDLPTALAVLTKTESPGAFPKLTPNPRAIPAEAPKDWPQFDQFADKVLSASDIFDLKPGAAEDTPEFEDFVKKYRPVQDALDEIRSDTSGKIYALMSAGNTLKLNIFNSKIRQTGLLGDSASISHYGGPQKTSVVVRHMETMGIKHFRMEIAFRIEKGSGRVAAWGVTLPIKLTTKSAPTAVVTTPGRFRLERCRLDQNDERIPNWLTSEYHFGEGAALWPKWRETGISVGPGHSYRLWRANGNNVVPVICDQGTGAPAWLDISDRNAEKPWGITVRLLRSQPLSRQSIRVNLETGMLEIQFHDAAAQPISEEEAAAGLSGACDIIVHDGWRPPLSNPELTREQYEKFVADLNYNGIYGLMALRFAQSITHQIPPAEARKAMDRLRDQGLEPREFLYAMLYADGLAKHCQKLGVKWDANDVEGSVKRVIEHYKK